jgi:FAD:protein FMN transferase
MDRVYRVEQVMGLPVIIHVPEATPEVAAAVERAFDWLREVDRRFSPFRPDSEVCRLGRGELDPADCAPDLREVLDLCAHYERASHGAFRSRLPGRGLDPCAVVKGWAVQRAAAPIRAAGADRYCLNAGGDVLCAGEPEPGRPWRIGLRHPERADTVCAVLGLRDGAVATSARYERGDHILDGRTGRPARGLLSVTVVADDLTTADATATAAFALGAEGARWAAGQPGCLVYAVDERRRVLRSPGLDGVLVQTAPTGGRSGEIPQEVPARKIRTCYPPRGDQPTGRDPFSLRRPANLDWDDLRK